MKYNIACIPCLYTSVQNTNVYLYVYEIDKSKVNSKI